MRHGDGVVAVALRASLSRDSLSDGELGIESAPAEKTPAPAVASVSVSDHASPADLTDLLRFLAAAVSVRRVPRQNALLSEHFNYHTHAHTHTHTIISTGDVQPKTNPIRPRNSRVHPTNPTRVTK